VTESVKRETERDGESDGESDRETETETARSRMVFSRYYFIHGRTLRCETNVYFS
jgi:hypothetical protein